MRFLKLIKKDGISLRIVYSWLAILATTISGLLIFATFHASYTFMRLSKATDEYIELQKAAYELMEASDYLTDMARFFSISGSREYLDNYFEEAFESRRREEAIDIMSQNPDGMEAFKQLQMAMDESMDLMNREYYAMRLVIEAKGYQDYPDVLKPMTLTSEDLALPSDKKMQRAEFMMFDTDYYNQKERIKADMKNSLTQLELLTHGRQSQLTHEFRSELKLVRIIILVQTIGIILTIWLSTRLSIRPILQAVERIREENPIPVMGANEFRYLARTYNKMYEIYKKSVENLSFKASHDELTKLYNRAGYNLILSSLDLKSTFLLLIDADRFKEINDQFGHETGDKILKKIAETVKKNFRSDDYICRIGGDEFVVFMVHANEQQKKLISAKILQINKELADTADGLPPVSVSVGISHGKNVIDTNTLFQQADQALYESKHNGRHGFVFYGANA